MPAQAVGAYGSRINSTPHLDRLAADGVRLDSMFCGNAICAPSRASILTGTHSHVNGVHTLSSAFDNRQPTFVGALRDAGYQTALFGKWHLGEGRAHEPVGFDSWQVLPDQGEYVDPEMIGPDGVRRHRGHTTDVITDLSLDWLAAADSDRPFCLLVHHKAPHRPWIPAERHRAQFEGVSVPQPDTLRDDYLHRATAAREARMRVGRDLTEYDLKGPVPAGLSAEAELDWRYQRYLRDYLACVAGVDESVGLILDRLDDLGVADDTIVVYTSDQGFFLGEHGWFDKRFMYEESLRMPFLVRYPREIPAASSTAALASNVDLAQTFCDYAGVKPPPGAQGVSLRPVLAGETPNDWRISVYYRYWEHDDGAHHVWAHYGIRTDRYKLVYYYADGLGLPGTSNHRAEPEWELFDLAEDPNELRSVHEDPAYADIRADLTARLNTLQTELGDAGRHHT